MRLFVLGATGKTGTAIVEQAIARGHDVTAFGRSPFTSVQSPKLSAVAGSPFIADELALILPGHDAVLSALGSHGLGRSTVRTDGARATIEAMRRSGPRRLIIVSSLLVDDHADRMSRIFAHTLLRHHAADQRTMERLVRESGLEWTIVRPPVLNNGALNKRYNVVVEPAPGVAAASLSRADVAHMMLDELETGAHAGQTVRMQRRR